VPVRLEVSGLRAVTAHTTLLRIPLDVPTHAGQTPPHHRIPHPAQSVSDLRHHPETRGHQRTACVQYLQLANSFLYIYLLWAYCLYCFVTGPALCGRSFLHQLLQSCHRRHYGHWRSGRSRTYGISTSFSRKRVWSSRNCGYAIFFAVHVLGRGSIGLERSGFFVMNPVYACTQDAATWVEGRHGGSRRTSGLYGGFLELFLVRGFYRGPWEPLSTCVARIEREYEPDVHSANSVGVTHRFRP
jgi:hypothetical protein